METQWSAELTPPAPQPQQSQQPQGQSAEKAEQLATRQLDKQKGKLAQALDSTASALRQSSGTLEQEGQPALKQAAEIGAQKAQEFSQYLRETDTTELTRKAREVVRQQPLVIAGAGFVLTLAAARLIKVLTQEPQPETPQLAAESQVRSPEAATSASQPEDVTPAPRAPAEEALQTPQPRRRTRRAPATTPIDGTSLEPPQ